MFRMVPLRLEMGTGGGAEVKPQKSFEQQDPKDARGGGSKLQLPLFSHYLRVIVEKFR